MDKKEKIVFEKIEIDKKTNEPKIVDVPLKNLEHNDLRKKEKLLEKEQMLESAGKQLVIEKVFGKTDYETDKISKKQLFFKRLSTFLFVAFVGVVLGITAYNDFFSGNKQLPSFETVSATLTSNWFYLAFALVAFFLCYFFKAFKLSFLCKYKTGKWHFLTCFETAILGHYYNYITPLAVGGQPFEIYHLSKNGVRGGVAASLPIATFFMLQLGFVILGGVSLFLYNNDYLHLPAHLHFTSPILVGLAITGLICCFAVPFLVILFSFLPKLGGKVVYFVIWLGSKLGLVKDRKTLNFKMTKNVLQNSKCLKSFASNPFIFLLSLIISFAENLSLCSIAYFTLKFFGYNLPADGFTEWIQVCALCMLLYSAISFIPTPGNSGAADLSFYWLFESGLTALGNIALPALLTWRLLSFYSFIIVGFLFTKILKRIQKRKEQKL